MSDLQWGPFVGPQSYRADGRNTVYLILEEGETAKLWQMSMDAPLCPINPQRALRYQEIPPCTCGHCAEEGITAAISAAAIAQTWEDRDNDLAESLA